MTSDIFKNLTKELIILLICIIIAGLMLVFSLSFLESSQLSRDAGNNQLITAKNKYHTALDRKVLLEMYENKFKYLETAGIIGEENRLNWIDVIEKTTNRFGIPYLKFKIEPRIIVNTPLLASTFPGIDLYRSTMILDMQLLHEGDLYSVLNSLDKNAIGLFDIQSCVITKNIMLAETLLESTSDRNFSSVCVINWYTIQTKTAVLPERRSS